MLRQRLTLRTALRSVLCGFDKEEHRIAGDDERVFGQVQREIMLAGVELLSCSREVSSGETHPLPRGGHVWCPYRDLARVAVFPLAEGVRGRHHLPSARF